jgi:hypothetical protein
VRVTATLDARGGARDISVRPEKPSSDERHAEIEPSLPDFVQEVRSLFPPRFPVEPIGVGAVWDVMRSSRLMGMRFHVTATFELLEAAGDRVKVRSYFAVTAPPQDFRVPGMPEGVEAKVRSFLLTGDSVHVHDLDRATPAEYDGTAVLNFDFDVVAGERSMRMGIETKQVESARRE